MNVTDVTEDTECTVYQDTEYCSIATRSISGLTRLNTSRS